MMQAYNHTLPVYPPVAPATEARRVGVLLSGGMGSERLTPRERHGSQSIDHRRLQPYLH